MKRILVYLCAVILLSTSCVECIDSNHIVQLHNNVREKIRNGEVPGQPRGVNLVTMQWDDALARGAQGLADKCIFKHEIAPDPRFGVGQNIYVSGSSNKQQDENWDKAIESWYNEYKVYTYSNQYQEKAGHYTQLVWHNTQYVGCGYAYCPDSPKFQNYYVCNYGPAGNVIGQYPYQAA